MKKLRVLDLFSGIGGFSLGLERTGGFQTVAFCEADQAARRVLSRHWPEVPCFPDIKTIKKEDVNERIDVICGGFPCQPHSVAGKREGASDDRNLWPAMLGCIHTWSPAWVVAENVPGLASTMLDEVVSDLEAAGYEVEVFCLSARDFGGDHLRERLWIVAHNQSERIQGVWPGGVTIPHALAGTFLPLRSSDGEWQVEPDLRRGPYGFSTRLDGRMNSWGERVKQLGNAVCPVIPEAIGYAILASEDRDAV